MFERLGELCSFLLLLVCSLLFSCIMVHFPQSYLHIYLAGWECHSLVSYYKHMTVFAVSIFVHVISVYKRNVFLL